MTDRTRTANTVGTEAEGRSAQNHSQVDRQVGEAVAWGFRPAGYAGAHMVCTERPDFSSPAWEIQPLIPASDLEQVTRERDALEKALEKARGELQHVLFTLAGSEGRDAAKAYRIAETATAEARTFLASLRSMEKTGG